MNRKDMIPRELIEGAQKMLELGASREIVLGFLLEKGWSESDASEVFSTIDAERSKLKEHKEEKASSEIIPAPVVQVPMVTSLPPPARPLVSREKDPRVEDVPETKVTTVEQTKEQKAPSLTHVEKQAPEVSHDKQKTQKVQAPQVEIKKELGRVPKKVPATKMPIRKPDLSKLRNDQALISAKSGENQSRHPVQSLSKKVKQLDVPEEAQEKEFVEEGVR